MKVAIRVPAPFAVIDLILKLSITLITLAPVGNELVAYTAQALQMFIAVSELAKPRLADGLYVDESTELGPRIVVLFRAIPPGLLAERRRTLPLTVTLLLEEIRVLIEPRFTFEPVILTLLRDVRYIFAELLIEMTLSEDSCEPVKNKLVPSPAICIVDELKIKLPICIS